MTQNPPQIPGRPSGAGWWVAALLALLLVAAGVWIWYLLSGPAPAPALSAAEERILDEKLDRLRTSVREAPAPMHRTEAGPGNAERPEIYREDPERRRIEFSERELNALIARDPALAGRAAVRLSPDQVSASFRVDLPEELLLFGGRSVRVQTGLQLLTRDERVQARLVGVSVAGVPLPDAWLGGLKGEDLLATSGLAALGAGIEALQVDDGHLHLLLAP
ncbi:hypothetical protein TVNIR_1273 [Thioalkalivibrio nitratireducens DSM 14787]|uniref:Arginine N-succinyltransferase n=1 Tax=Thioalkalivibrio nitratireducens (strain DSM 14787 / UNIQEM 213 / ALEN2) TaxID=1255043 RepID=L0DX76_THIND|nr:hypothetical protein [Thioalkalivibrio nitratireducens]AGA32946.1 hypothetical protein TVNIR_1273 [Thioalkalivibrio nitratireducens DSM 14787]